MIPLERLKERLKYDPETGLFICLVGQSPLNVGDVAGYVDQRGYRYITIDRHKSLAHRWAWFYMTGGWPTNEIDHKNGVKDDNRFGNLRQATHLLNQQNQRKAQRKNKAGLLGVCAKRNGFMASIKVNGKNKWLGSFSTPELAHAAYVAAKRKFHEGCTI